MSQFEASHIADGISQSERYPRSLQPDFFQIDERDMDDMLRFIIELSQHFNYYDLNNQIDGNWEDILLSDINIVLRIIPKFGVNSFIKKYDHLKNSISHQESDEVNLQYVNRIFQFLNNFIGFQESVHHKFRVSSRADQGMLDFRKIVDGHDSFEEELDELDQLVQQARDAFGTAIELPVFRKVKGRDIDVTTIPTVALEGSHTFARIGDLLHKTNTLFGAVRSKYSRLTEAAEWYLYKQKAGVDDYEPHTALLISFLELYQYLKSDLNQLTGKHLDFYYKDILGIQPKEAVPDKAHIVATLNPAFDQYLLPKGEVLLASVPDTDESLRFEVDEDLLVTKAAIQALNTVYVSETVKIPVKSEEYEDVKELQVFFANNPVLADKHTPSWPLLGEDQSDLSFDKCSMQPADMGLLVASPLFYAEDGKRNLRVKFYIHDKSAAGYLRHVRNFAGVTDSNEKVLIFEMLSKAFLVSITGKENWITVDKYTIHYELENVTDKFIEIDFELGHNDPPVGVYQSAIHGYEINTGWPLLRLQINNHSFHNPYTFLKDMVLQRVGVRLSVTDSMSVQLQNNIGTLSMASPFQVFGPQPSVGSYLDIHNPNIFNRYTKHISIRFHWFDLPRDKGGFETYYASYPKNFGNNAFKVAISALNDGRHQPVPELRQHFSLFEMGKEPGTMAYLSSTTEFEGVDFSKIRFTNAPALDEMVLGAENAYKEGSVRFELTSPEEGFGHRIFPGLFPEVIMHNAKRFSKKMAIPNQPYIPVLSRIAIDYTLEHTEAVNGINKESKRAHNLNLWHFTPFGYRSNYPSNDVSEMFFVPVLKDQSNLFIGLSDVLPGQLLSLFFQIEDNDNDDASFEIATVNWAVLQDNKWKEIPRADVLQDSTGNFINNGIVILRLPETDAGVNTVLDAAYYWLRVSCNKRGDLRTKVKGIFTQAFTVSRLIDSSVSPGLLQLDAGMIKATARTIPQLQEVRQPYPSFNGRQEESSEKYYARVSERLHHKQRPITTTDIAEIVLEAFPDIIKVHCLGAGINVTAQQNEESDVKIVVIPGKQAHTLDSLEEPKASLSTLFQIRKLVASKLPSFIKVDVVNPVYERVKVVCGVIFNDAMYKESVGNNISRLNRDIRRFISPWLFNADSDVQMEGRLYTSEILNFIKKCPYVVHVTSFSVLHFYRIYDEQTARYEARVVDSAIQKVDFLKGSLPGSILISAPEHEIIVLPERKYLKPQESGIGGLVIGEELLVVNERNSQVIEPEKADTDEERFDFTFQVND